MSAPRESPVPAPVSEVSDPEGPSTPAAHEWLVTNGLGGYASGTVPGIITRRFHGLLVAALPAPRGRTMMLNHLTVLALANGSDAVQLGAQERPVSAGPPVPIAELAGFWLDQGLPVWRFRAGDVVIERRVRMPHGQNTVHVVHQLIDGPEPVKLVLEPWIHFRPHEGRLDEAIASPYVLQAIGNRYEVSSGEGLPPLRMRVHGDGSAFTIEGRRLHDVRYHVEQSRGYDAIGSLYGPGSFVAEVRAGRPVTFVASSEPWEMAAALSEAEAESYEHERRARLIEAAHPQAREGVAADLVDAADQFLVTPAGRLVDTARAYAAGDAVRTVIAGYPWFTDWGRDTMISLEGLTLVTGRHAEAGDILRTFARYVRDGLIPNMFPEGENAGRYDTADATLWFFHAIDRYVATTGDRATLRRLLPVLVDIAEHHLRGTSFGIGVDPQDGLLREGAEGYALTWMDAKLPNLVVTPRRGKPVEINALFYNALRLLESWLREERGVDEARSIAGAADRVRESFNARFWSAAGGYLYDVVDGETGDDDAFRPNQVLAISLTYPVLDRGRWREVMTKVKERLLTPVGLRTLAPGHPDYKSKYFGDLRARDMAYHQGTVWPWLIGPFVDAWRKTYPEDVEGARSIAVGVAERVVGRACAGSVSEIFDAEEPYTPRGCFAQAWSVAEVLRVLVRTA